MSKELALEKKEIKLRTKIFELKKAIRSETNYQYNLRFEKRFEILEAKLDSSKD
jgi:hypothetical protein